MLYIAIPALDELEYLPQTIEALAKQKTEFPFSIYVCVNQPDIWWYDDERIEVCKKNQQLLKDLKGLEKLKKLFVIDKTSQGNGWQEHKCGVGWARKTLFDKIIESSDEEDVIISMDADTLFNENYLQSIGENFTQNKIEVLSLPYYHKLAEDETANRAILRYEIYLRNYFINMHRIGSPYTFTALGSAIAVTVKTLKKIRGITPLRNGEDFYLLQKLRKMTHISNYNSEIVYPATRFSTRVPFGTGPAMIKGATGNWGSYPIYHHSFFDIVKETYDIIPELFTKDIDTEFITFLKKQYKTNDLWGPLRKNFKTLSLFIHAFHEKADGLKILQFLKMKEAEGERQKVEGRKKLDTLSLLGLSAIREALFEIETKMRKMIKTTIP